MNAKKENDYFSFPSQVLAKLEKWQKRQKKKKRYPETLGDFKNVDSGEFINVVRLTH